MVNAKQLLNTRIDKIVEIASTYLQKQGYPASPNLYALSFDPEYLKRLKRKQDFLFPWYPFYKPETITSINILKPHSSISKMEHPNSTPLLIKKSKILRLSKRSKSILTFLETHNFEKSPMDIEKMTEAVWLNYQIILQAPKLKQFASSSVSPVEASLLTLDFMTYVASSDIALDYPDITRGIKVKEGKKKANESRKNTINDRNAILFEEFKKIYEQNPYARKTWLTRKFYESFDWESNEVPKIGIEQLRRIIREFVKKM